MSEPSLEPALISDTVYTVYQLQDAQESSYIDSYYDDISTDSTQDVFESVDSLSGGIMNDEDIWNTDEIINDTEIDLTSLKPFQILFGLLNAAHCVALTQETLEDINDLIFRTMNEWARGIKKGQNTTLSQLIAERLKGTFESFFEFVDKVLEIFIEDMISRMENEIEKKQNKAKKWGWVPFYGTVLKAQLPSEIEHITEKYMSIIGKAMGQVRGLFTACGFNSFSTRLDGKDVNAGYDDLQYSVQYKHEGRTTMEGHSYIDMVDFNDQIAAQRAFMIGVSNMYRIALSESTAAQGRNDVIFETMTSLKSMGSVGNKTARLIDHNLNAYLNAYDKVSMLRTLGAKLYNQMVYCELQGEKDQLTTVLGLFGDALMCIGLVLCWTPIGIIFTVLGAIVRYIGARIDYDQRSDWDDYNPGNGEGWTYMDEGNSSISINNYGNSLDVIDEVSNQSTNNVNPANSMYGKEPPMKGWAAWTLKAHINNDQIMNQLGSLVEAQCALRFFYVIADSMQSINDAIFYTATGVRPADNSSQLISSASEATSSQAFKIFDNKVSALDEYQWAINNAWNEERQMNSASTVFMVSMVASVLGALAGAALSYALNAAINIGVSVGFTLFNILGQLLSTYLTEANNLENKFSGDEIDLSDGKNDPNADFYEQIDDVETRAFKDFLDNGIRDAGDGYVALNYTAMAEAQMQFLYTMNAKAVPFAIEELRQEINNMIASAAGGASIKKSSVQGIIQAQAIGKLRALNFIAKQIQEKVDIQNAKCDAKKQIQRAGIVAAVAVVIAGLAYGLSGVSQVFFRLASMIMNLASSVTNAIWYAVQMNQGKGDLEKDVSVGVKSDSDEIQNESRVEQNRRSNSGNPTLNALENLDSELGTFNINQGMLENIGGGYLGLNTAFLTEAKLLKRALLKVLENISKVAEAKEERIAMIAESAGNVAASPSDVFKSFVRNNKMLILNALSNYFNVLRSYAQRNNQIKGYEAGLYKALCHIALDAVLLALSVKPTMEQIKMEKKAAEIKKLQNKINKKYVSLKRSVPKELLKQLRTLKSQFKSMKSAISKSKGKTFITSSKFRLAYSILHTVVSCFIDSIIDAAILGAKEKNTSKTEEKLREAKEKREQEKLQKDGSMNKYEAMESLDNLELSLNFERGLDKLNLQNEGLHAQAAEEAGQGFMTLLKYIYSIVKSLKNAKAKTRKSILPQKNQQVFEKIKDIRNKLAANPQAAAALQKSYKDFQQAIQNFQKERTPQTQAQVLNAYADFVEKLIQNKTQLTKLSSDVKELAKTLKQKGKTKTGKIAKMMSQKVKELDETARKLKDLMEQLKKDPSKTAHLTPNIQELADKAVRLQGEIRGVANTAVVEGASENAPTKAIEITIDKIAKKLSGKKLEEMNAQELKELHIQLRARVFRPASAAEQHLKVLHNAIMNKLKGRVLSQEDLDRVSASIKALEGGAFLSAGDKKVLKKIKALLNKKTLSKAEDTDLRSLDSKVLQLQGVASETRQAYNKYIGRIGRRYKKLTGKDLVLDNKDEIVVPKPLKNGSTKPSGAGKVSKGSGSQVTGSNPQVDGTQPPTRTAVKASPAGAHLAAKKKKQRPDVRSLAQRYNNRKAETGKGMKLVATLLNQLEGRLSEQARKLRDESLRNSLPKGVKA